MIPARYEYLVVLALFLQLTIALFPDQARRLIQQSTYWYSQSLLVAYSTVIDLVAVRLGWWEFSSQKSLGVSLFGLPIEEFILFFLFHFAACCSWDAYGGDLA